MKIIEATVENFKRIEVLTVTPAGDIVEITGNNGQGKSSTLDAIECALGGKRRDPGRPIRRGAEEDGARVVLNLGDLVVERRWTDKSDRLVVKTPDGASYPKAQSRLDELVAGLAFDPMAFMGLKPADQRERLLEVIGVDLEAFERRHAKAYDQRREIGRDLRSAQARLDGAEEVPEGTPAEEIQLSDLTTELRRAHDEREANDRARVAADRARRVAEDAAAASVESRQRVARLKAELKTAEEAAGAARNEEVIARADQKKAADEAAKLVDPDLEAIETRIAEAEEINQAVRLRKRNAKLALDVKRLEGHHETAEQTLKKIAAEKEAALTDADMPVDGLSIDGEMLTLDGLPLDQASMSRQIQVCTAITGKLNPELRIALVRHGNDLDEATLKAFYESCREIGLQAWVERISGITEDAIVIEEGRIAGSEGEERS